MTSKISAWISAARLRTLPLSISGIVVGAALALKADAFNSTIFILSLLTTIGLQVLSNFANDYGDGVKGTDNEDRVGPMRAIQSGMITDAEMKKGIILTVILTFLMAVALIYVSFGQDNFIISLIFLVLGIGGIAAAILYTVGKSAYGYKGLGDVFVFIFFGLVSVLGSTFLYTQELQIMYIFPALAIGLWSTAVLNLNNLRDVVGDQNANKNTLVVKMGYNNGKKYHAGLIFGGILAVLVYGLYAEIPLYYWVTLIPCALLIGHLKRVLPEKMPVRLDPELKKVALSTFLFSVMFLGIIVASSI
ncbi:1,4-dihydroxy-2-naphthoate octaprenyltransferase [Gangjinia marincola]|uniref:1,4-dihydroxy-2-naphthoate octaprenyltransferase n=1 Tax=Gangjinia marincola TaxID=578463 RepID=A0ABN1MGA9_9FLAO